MKLYKAEALVLRARDCGDGDKLLTLFSREYGKIRVIAHGVAKPASRKRGSVQPFTLSRFLLYRGRELDSVSQCEGLEMFSYLRESLEKISFASYLTELVDALAPDGEPNETLFLLLLTTLRLMGEGDPEMLARAFEIKAAGLMGYRPVLENCASCGETAGGRLYFSPALGGLLCEKCSCLDSNAFACNRGIVEILKKLLNWHQSRMHQLKTDPATRKQIGSILHEHLKFHLGCELKSPSFLNRFFPSGRHYE